MTDDQGRYALEYTKGKPGGLIGRHKVYINFMDPNPDGTPVAMTPEKREIMEKYGSEATTPLKAEVTQTGQVVDFQLE
jgi:hypothetical protein